jgi:non-specific serine/threonine protein kinase
VREIEGRLWGAEQAQNLDRVDEEIDNLRSALEWAFESGQAELGGELAARLERYWWVRRKTEGVTWLERALGQPGLTPELRLPLLGAAGGVAYFTGSIEQSIELFRDAVELARGLGDRMLTARMLARSAPALFVAGRVDEGAPLVEEAVAINREIGFASGLAESLHIYAGAAREQGDVHTSIQRLEESLAVAREIDDAYWIGANLMNLADTWLELGEPERALLLAREALEGERAAVDDLQTMGCMNVLACCFAGLGDSWRAGVMWGAATRIDDEVGDSPWRGDRPRLEKMLGERTPEFESGVAEGLRLSVDDARRVAVD